MENPKYGKIGELHTKDIVLILLVDLIAEHCTQKAVAELLGITDQYLNDVLRGRREPGKKILYPLGFEKITRYMKFDYPLKSYMPNEESK